MGRRGPKPRPDHLKAIAGVEERYRNRAEPTPAGADELIDLKVPPRGLGAPAARVWRRLAPDLVDKHMLTAWDVDLFAVFCRAKATHDQLWKAMGADVVVPGSVPTTMVKSAHWRAVLDCVDVMLRLSARFGFTPGDRASLAVVGGVGGSVQLGAERLLS